MYRETTVSIITGQYNIKQSNLDTGYTNRDWENSIEHLNDLTGAWSSLIAVKTVLDKQLMVRVYDLKIP